MSSSDAYLNTCNQGPSAQEAQAAVDMFVAGRYDEAMALAQQLTAQFPIHSFGWKLLGAIYVQTGHHMAALAPLRKAAHLSPSDAETHSALGAALLETNQLSAAVESLLRAVELRPDFAEAHSNMGIALTELGRFDEALASCRRALEIRPDFAEPHNTLGGAFNHLGQFDEAVSSCRRALKSRPNFVLAYCNLGASLKALGRYDDAIATFRKAIEIARDHVDAHYNLANALRDYGQIDAALDSYRRALEINPDFHSARWNLGLALLAQGRYAEGWPCYEARTGLGNKKIVTEPGLSFPSWCGEPLAGRSIVIIEEQGIGDDIQFCRYASTLKQMGATHVTLVCKNRLRPLFSRMKRIDSVIERRDIATVEPHDFWVYAQSLPFHCGTTVETVPADVPCLFADAALTERVAGELGRFTDLKIGICWKGSAAYKGDAERSPGIGSFKPIFRIDGVRIFTLLPDSRGELIASAGDKAADIGHEVDECTAPFEETAALIMNLDLVVTSDTSIGHLAGALGKPVWLVLPYAAHWVWMTDREDSPWYPNTRLFRQTERGNWAEVFERVARKLRAVLAGEMPLVWPIE